MKTPHPTSLTLGHLPLKGKAFRNVKGERYMKATGIVSLHIREGDPLLTTLTPIDRFCWAIHSVVNRYKETAE